MAIVIKNADGLFLRRVVGKQSTWVPEYLNAMKFETLEEAAETLKPLPNTVKFTGAHVFETKPEEPENATAKVNRVGQ